MIMKKNILSAALVALSLIVLPAMAADDHSVPQIEKQAWSFSGPFGTYDRNQLRRGFQIFREVCSGCHGARLIAFRNLSEPGGPEYSEAQVKALAASYEVKDANVEGGTRPAVAADRWPSPFANDQEARDANGGAVPPDFSVLAKARNTSQPFPWWLLNYVTAYQEGGPDYIHALLVGYEDEPPADVADFPEGKYYNHYFPGHAIAMAPPLSDGAITYQESEHGSVPETLDQYARDVSAFMFWMADPHMVERKETGFRVILFLILFGGIMYLVKRRLWSGVAH
jgi:ubiquinol-cytochrome c reductase cytochrome c1 subunit